MMYYKKPLPPPYYPRRGFTKTFRDKWYNPIFKDMTESAIWGWICEMAAWEDFEISLTQPSTRVIQLKAGQLYITSRLIASLFDITEHKARMFLKRIQQSNLASLDAHKVQGTVLTITDYKDHLFKPAHNDSHRLSTAPMTAMARRSNTSSNTNSHTNKRTIHKEDTYKNINTDHAVKEEINDFEIYRKIT